MVKNLLPVLLVICLLHCSRGKSLCRYVTCDCKEAVRVLVFIYPNAQNAEYDEKRQYVMKD